MPLADIAPASLRSPLLALLASHAEALTVPRGSYLPLAPIALAHAVRCSIGARAVGHKARPSLLVSTALNLLLLFGSLSVVCVLLGRPNPILLAPHTIALYSAVHVLLDVTGLGWRLHEAQQTRGGALAVHLYCSAVDALCRSEGIAVLGVQAVRSHPDPAIASSGFATVLIGFLIGGGTPLLIGLLGLDTAHWGWRVPPWLQRPSLLLQPDIWSSALVAALFAAMTSPKGFASLSQGFSSWASRQSPAPIFTAPLSLSRALLRIEQASPAAFGGGKESAYLPAREARILVGLMLFAILASAKLHDAVSYVSPKAAGVFGGASSTKMGGRKSIPSQNTTLAQRRALKKQQ